MADRAPAFSFYAQDWLVGTFTMSLADRGAYITLLAYQWDKGSVPDSPLVLGKICGCNEAQARRFWAVISDKFPRGEDGSRRNLRLESERQKQANRREAMAANGKKGAEHRWGQARGQPIPKRWQG